MNRKRVRTLTSLGRSPVRNRKFLLGLSVLGIGMVFTGLIPTEISALGITFGATDQQRLLLVLAGITFYFLIAFLIYGRLDYLEFLIRSCRQSCPSGSSLRPNHADAAHAIAASTLQCHRP